MGRYSALTMIALATPVAATTGAMTPTKAGFFMIRNEKITA